MKRTLTGVVGSAVLILATVGCGSPEPMPTPTITVTVTASPKPAPTVTVTATPESEAPPVADAPDAPLSEEARRDLYILTLTGIDQGLTVEADRALRRGDNICLDIEQGKDDATLIANAEARFEGGTVPDLTADQARQIVDAARSYHC